MVTNQRTRDFIVKSSSLYGNRFSYAYTNYVGLRYTVTLVCEKHDLKFTVIAKKHLTSKCGGCPRCAAEIVLRTLDEPSQEN